MKRLLLRWILLALSVVIASAITKALGLGFDVDVSTTASVLQLLVGVAILSLLNATLGRIVKFITLPLSCLTLGLFALVVNACVLMLAASLHMGFYIADKGGKAFFAAFVASLIIAFTSGVLGVFLPDDKDDD